MPISLRDGSARAPTLVRRAGRDSSLTIRAPRINVGTAASMGIRSQRRVGCLPVHVACGALPMDDLLIRQATVYDGSGADPTRADLAVRAGRIRAIAPTLSKDAKRVIDADGLALMPGIVD